MDNVVLRNYDRVSFVESKKDVLVLFLVGRRVSLRARNISQCDNLDGELEPCSIFIWDGESFQEGKTCKINECSCTKATRRTVDIESPDACTLWNSLDIFIHIHIVPGETHWNLPFIFKHIEAFFHPPCVCVFKIFQKLNLHFIWGNNATPLSYGSKTCTSVE